MKLCEIVRAAKTAPDALTTAVAVARKIAKVPAVVGVCDGFVGNRMLAQRGKQAEKLLFEGALPQQVDAVVTKFGMPMGPFAMGDLAGLDIGWRSRKDRGIKSEIADALCEAGRFGQKTGKGYYKYEGGSRAPLPDPEVEKLIDETLQRLGRKRRVVSDDEILERMMVSDDQRGGADPGGRHRGASERHRCDLALRLWLADLPRRPDVLCRPGRPQAHRRPAVVLRQGDQRSLARTGAAAQAPRRRRQDVCVAGADGESGLMAMHHSSPHVIPRCAARGRGRIHWRDSASVTRLAARTHCRQLLPIARGGADDPSRRKILSGRRPLGRSDRARDAARSVVERRPSNTARGRRSSSAIARSATPELEAWSKSRRPPSCAPAMARTPRWRCSSAIRPIIPSISSAR